MDHRASIEDNEFRRTFEACELPRETFHHDAHIRLAYVYLCEGSVEYAIVRMRGALLGFVDHLGVDRAKYHETITRAWILAVRHFMARSMGCASAAEFMEKNPILLKKEIMLTHYSTDVLLSENARRAFMNPDISAIPQYE